MTAVRQEVANLIDVQQKASIAAPFPLISPSLKSSHVVMVRICSY